MLFIKLIATSKTLFLLWGGQKLLGFLIIDSFSSSLCSSDAKDSISFNFLPNFWTSLLNSKVFILGVEVRQKSRGREENRDNSQQVRLTRKNEGIRNQPNTSQEEVVIIIEIFGFFPISKISFSFIYI